MISGYRENLFSQLASELIRNLLSAAHWSEPN